MADNPKNGTVKVEGLSAAERDSLLGKSAYSDEIQLFNVQLSGKLKKAKPEDACAEILRNLAARDPHPGHRETYEVSDFAAIGLKDLRAHLKKNGAEWVERPTIRQIDNVMSYVSAVAGRAGRVYMGEWSVELVPGGGAYGSLIAIPQKAGRMSVLWITHRVD